MHKLTIARSKQTGKWFVIDTLYGVHVKFAADTKRECIQHCKKMKWRYDPMIWIW